MKKKVAVQCVKIDARHLLTIGPESPWWNGGNVKLDVAKGSIVRVRPPSFASDQDIELLERLLHGTAAKVRVEQRAQSDVVPDDEAPELVSHANQREVVVQMAQKSRRKEELVELLDFYLTKAGL